MPRIEPIELSHATGRTRELLDELASRGGEPGLDETDIALAARARPPTRTAAAVGATGCGRCVSAE